MQIRRLVAVYWVLLAVTVLWVFDEGTAHAYLDGGTATFLFQILIGAVALGTLSLKLFWNRVTNFVRRWVLRIDVSE